MGDLRMPIGVFFLILGVLLETVAGAQAPLTDIRVNTYSGAAMIVFGLAMVLLARRTRS